MIEKPTWFRLYAMWEGETTNVKTGKYLIKDNLTPRQVLAILVAGVKEVTTKVTLPEGKNMLEYFELIENGEGRKRQGARGARARQGVPRPSTRSRATRSRATCSPTPTSSASTRSRRRCSSG